MRLSKRRQLESCPRTMQDASPTPSRRLRRSSEEPHSRFIRTATRCRAKYDAHYVSYETILASLQTAKTAKSSDKRARSDRRSLATTRRYMYGACQTDQERPSVSRDDATIRHQRAHGTVLRTYCFAVRCGRPLPVGPMEGRHRAATRSRGSHSTPHFHQLRCE